VALSLGRSPVVTGIGRWSRSLGEGMRVRVGQAVTSHCLHPNNPASKGFGHPNPRRRCRASCDQTCTQRRRIRNFMREVIVGAVAPLTPAKTGTASTPANDPLGRGGYSPAG
jgi:hypothetical protein